MTKQQENDVSDDSLEIDLDFGLDDDYDLIFDDLNVKHKQRNAKSKKNARKRVEDYMERKAFNKKVKEWDFRFDS